MYGGIVGDYITGYGQAISKCYNAGDVTGDTNVGGISGYLGAQGYAGTETMCYDKGKVTGTSKVGAIVGGSANDAVVTNCYYYTTETSLQGIGAINSGGTDIETARQGTILTDVDLTTYDQFITWIENLE